MDYLNELYDLYCKNQDIVGEIKYVEKKTKKGTLKIPLVLLPISHETVAAQITVTIDEEGNFLRAAPVEVEDKLTIIPVTEESASRTAGKAPHPLCDNLKYLAGDYMDYYESGKGKDKDYAENYQLYIEALKRWSESDYSHKKVRAVYQYLSKGCLLKDLAAAGIIILNDHGKIDDKKILSIAQADSFVRFQIQQTDVLDAGVLADKTGADRGECWKDKTLQKAFIEYYRSISKKKGLSYLSGNIETLSVLQPKKIRNEGDGAKLISSNDKECFTFRGRFADRSEAFSIGYEDSQMAHNALKWIIRKQGYSWDSLCVVIWESDLKPLPDLMLDTDSMYDEVCGEYEGWDDDEEAPQYLGTNEIGASKFAAAMRGYGKCYIGQNSRTVLLALDSATPGRLSLTEFQQYQTSNYFENIIEWQTSCEWQHVKFKEGKAFPFMGMIGINEIAEALYGAEQNGILTINGKKMYEETFKRFLPCISGKRPVPEGIVRLAVSRASSPVSFKEWYNWERVLALACSLVKRQRYKQNPKEEWNVALDVHCCERNYLYGRLLAVADRVEYRTYEKDDRRETNAQRYMAAFAQRPMSTWKVLEGKLQPYWMRLKPGERIVYKNLIDDIFGLFTVESFGTDKPLEGLYLLGFHSQALALRKKPENDLNEEE